MSDTSLGPNEFITVVHGIDVDFPDMIRNHPRVSTIKVSRESSVEGVASIIPNFTKIFILTELVPHSIYFYITKKCKESKDGLVYLHRRNQTAVIETVKSYFPEMLSKFKDNASKGDGESREWAGHGRIQKFLEENQPDLSKGSAEEARRLLGIALNKGIHTTSGSLAQAISNMKRKKGMGEIPASARKKDPRAEALQILDDAISNLQFIREYVATTSTRNDELEAKLNKMKEMFA